MRSSSPGNRSRARRYLQAARDHEALYKLIERASTEEGRQNLGLLKDLGAAYRASRTDPRSQGVV